MVPHRIPRIALLALLTACDPAPEPGPPSGNAPPADTMARAREAPAGAPGPAPDSVWTLQVTGAGVGLTLTGPGGEALFRLSCARDPARMAIEAETFTQIGSEERLSFGADGEPYVFVADVSEPRPAGVHAEAPIDSGLLERLSVAREVSAVYGVQKLGPVAAPERELMEDFVAGCRAVG